MKRRRNAISDEEKIARYAHVLGNVPASVADRAYAFAFGRLSGSQREGLVDEMTPELPVAPRAEASVDPEAFALLMRDLSARVALVHARGAAALTAEFVVSPPIVAYFTTGTGSVSIDEQPPWLQELANHETAPLDAGRMHHRRGLDTNGIAGGAGSG